MTFMTSIHKVFFLHKQFLAAIGLFTYIIIANFCVYNNKSIHHLKLQNRKSGATNNNMIFPNKCDIHQFV